MGALGLRIRLRHVRPSLGLAIEVGPIAVVDIARRVHPHQARTAASRLWHRCCLGRRRGFRRLSRRRSRRRSGRRCGSRSSRCGLRSWSSSRSSSWCLGSWSRGIPLLHSLVSTTSPGFARRRRVRPILTKTGRSCRRCCLRYRKLRNQQTRRKHNKTNPCSHEFSKKIRFC